MGCDFAVTFRHESVCTEDWVGDEPPAQTVLATFPSEPKCRAKSLRGISDKSDRIYKETIIAINSGSLTLAAAGLRALVEGLCKECGVTDGLNAKGNRVDNLEGKINGLSENGHLTTKHAQSLHQLRFIGNDAVHELDEVPEPEALLGLEIIEHMLDAIFGLDEKHATLLALRTHRKNPPSTT